MKIRKLRLYTTKLVEEKNFYVGTLGFSLLEESSNHFTLKIGWSEFTFEKSNTPHLYHYCFLIPSNQLQAARNWLSSKTDIIEIEDGQEIQFFESWNAESFYFYDASGNLAEFIVRHDLKNEIEEAFDFNQVLCVNEIGLPTQNIPETNNLLAQHLKTQFWKGDFERFGTHGTQEGLFLLPNYAVKDIWFPTEIPITPSPFEAIIENDEVIYSFEFKEGRIKF